MEFSFVDAEKGLDAKTFKKDTNFLFCRDWICVFGHRRVTSKETQASSWVLDGSGFGIFLDIGQRLVKVEHY